MLNSDRASPARFVGTDTLLCHVERLDLFTKQVDRMHARLESFLDSRPALKQEVEAYLSANKTHTIEGLKRWLADAARRQARKPILIIDNTRR